MKSIDRKTLILSKISSEKFSHIYEAMRVLEGEINALEAIPVGSKNEPIRIAEDFSDGHIDAKE